jgi:hypothetical protein
MPLHLMPTDGVLSCAGNRPEAAAVFVCSRKLSLVQPFAAGAAATAGDKGLASAGNAGSTSKGFG